MKPIKKHPIHPLLRIASILLPAIIAVASATVGIIILLKEPSKKVEPIQKEIKMNSDTNNYKP